ncbi:hypothetical protein [Clostridium saccharoperbutylacetonicum]|uniref:hypothetical protein n=1 Tax=Clostridium saccharoperbutylacetonicum TaxID=36745 RepID=UPI0009839C80|nr:hypothetical protein [Clostridium saccharoperbutylacetonicum]AQR92811.1 hypothetical protein CLSAP_00720 [Clostridium saccharoperbutylacetonicum]NSB34222.1 hypothetical protein [Clostridium saccharoperbutylacetonicum]
MNKRQLIVISILLSLMLILVMIQGVFKENFEQIALISQGISEFKEYTFDENKYNIFLPSEWIVEEKESKGKYVSSTLNFKGKDNKIKGLLQVINTREDVNVFAENDLNNQYLEYYNSELVPFKNSNSSGVLVKYETSIKGGYEYKNECYYLNVGEGKVIKVSFNLIGKDYEENMNTIVNAIISSIKGV